MIQTKIPMEGLDELELSFDLNIDDFSDLSINIEDEFSSRYIKPPKTNRIGERFLKYKNAETLAKDLQFGKDARFFIIVDGTFYFGDFIEAFLVKNRYKAKRLTISTLSMSNNNVDSFHNLIKAGYIDSLAIIVSDFFYSHTRHTTVKYAYEQLDIDNCFQLAAASTHCKIALIETECGLKITMHGSANLRSSSNIDNLRSSSNIEQFQIEENAELYDWNLLVQDSIIETYKTINHEVKNHKSVRRNKLWQSVNLQPFKEPLPKTT